MKAVILAGGLGTRLSEETHVKPKPMLEIGEKPILWHIMKIYAHFGINDFIICCGYKGYVIKEYFANYFLHMSDVTFDMKNNKMEVHNNNAENWRITLINTGQNTATGGRLLKVKDYLKDEPFCFTYGDGVADVNIKELLKFHKLHNKTASLTAVYPSARYGALEINNGAVSAFKEKPRGDGAKINGGFFVLNPNVFEFIDDESTPWEGSPLEKLANAGELMAYQHEGFWQPMDTLRDKIQLNSMWSKNRAPWKFW